MQRRFARRREKLDLIALLALSCVTFALGFGELMIAGILPAVAAGTGTSIPIAGQLVTVYALVFAVVSPPLAVSLRIAPAKRVLVASLLVVALANGVAAGTHQIAVLLIARVVAALGSAAATPLALAAVDRVAHEDVRGRAQGIVFTGFSLAAMLGVPLGTLIAARWGWPATFGCVVALSGAAAALVAAVVPAAAGAAPIGWAALRRVVRRPALRATLIVSALFLTAQYTAFTYFRVYFERVGGEGIGSIVLLFAVFGAFGIAGTLAGGVAVDRGGPRTAMLLTTGGCSLGLVVLPFVVRTMTGSGLAVALWALTSWAFGPAVNRRLAVTAGDAGDIALAFNLTAFNAGIAAGSALGGATIASAGLPALPIVAAAVGAAAFVVAAVPVRT